MASPGRPSGSGSNNRSLLIVCAILAALVLLGGGTAAILLSQDKSSSTAQEVPTADNTTPVVPVQTTTSTAPSAPSSSTPPTPPGTDPTDLSSTPPPSKAPTIDSKICAKKNPPKLTVVLTSDEPVDVSQGAKFLIAPCLKKGESIWIFNFTSGDELYILDTHTSKSGVQPYTDKITGDVTVNFILADTNCAEWIAGQDPNADYGSRIVLNDNLIHHPGCKLVSYKVLTVATTQN